MLKFKIKFDDKEMFKELAGQKAIAHVGFFENQYYEPIEESFYSNQALPKYSAKKRGSEIGYDYNYSNYNAVKARKIYARPKISVAQVAIANEYGVPEHNVPPRPFMWRTFDGNAKKWAKIVQDELPQMKKLDLKRMIKRLASIAVRDTQKTIDELQYPPNAESTIRAKGFNNPLIDSGQMRDSVTWRLVR